MAARKRTYAELVQEIEEVKVDLKDFLGAEASSEKLQAIDKELEDVKLMLETKRPFQLTVGRATDPIATGTSHLNINGYNTIYHEKDGYVTDIQPECYQITWHTGKFRGIICEYADSNGNLQNGLTSITDFAEQVEPVIGSGGVDADGNVIPFGKVLGYTDLADGIIRDFDGDINVPGMSRCMSFDENGVCNVSGESMSQSTLHDNQWYRIDKVSTRLVDDGYIFQWWIVVRFYCHLQPDPAKPTALSKWMKFKKTMFHCAKFCYDVYTMDVWDKRSVDVKFATKRPKAVEDYLLKVAMSSWPDRQFEVVKSD